MSLHAQDTAHTLNTQRSLLGSKRRLAVMQQLQNIRRDAIEATRPQLQLQIPLRHRRRPRRLNVPQERQQPLLNGPALLRVVGQPNGARDARDNVGDCALGLVFEHGHDELGLPRLVLGGFEGGVVEEPDDVALDDGLGEGVPGAYLVEDIADGELVRGGWLGVDELLFDVVEFLVFSGSQLHGVGDLGRFKVQVLVVVHVEGWGGGRCYLQIPIERVMTDGETCFEILLDGPKARITIFSLLSQKLSLCQQVHKSRASCTQRSRVVRREGEKKAAQDSMMTKRKK